MRSADISPLVYRQTACRHRSCSLDACHVRLPRRLDFQTCHARVGLRSAASASCEVGGLRGWRLCCHVASGLPALRRWQGQSARLKQSAGACIDSGLHRHLHRRCEPGDLSSRARPRQRTIVHAGARGEGRQPELSRVASGPPGPVRGQRNKHSGRRKDGRAGRLPGECGRGPRVHQRGAERRRRPLLRLGASSRRRTRSSPTTAAAAWRSFRSAPTVGSARHHPSCSTPDRVRIPRGRTDRTPTRFGTAPGDAFVLATDLGADRLFVYRFDPRRGTLTPT